MHMLEKRTYLRIYITCNVYACACVSVYKYTMFFRMPAVCITTTFYETEIIRSPSAQSAACEWKIRYRYDSYADRRPTRFIIAAAELSTQPAHSVWCNNYYCWTFFVLHDSNMQNVGARMHFDHPAHALQVYIIMRKQSETPRRLTVP